MKRISAGKNREALTPPERAIADRIAAQVTVAEQLIAAFALNAPVPIRRLYGMYGSRTTFHKWKGMGLDVKPIPGMGPTVVPIAFRDFLMRLRGEYGPFPATVAPLDLDAASAPSAAEEAG